MNKLPLRYNDSEGMGFCEALLPSQCRRGCDDNGILECIGGERVRVEWLGTFNNNGGESSGVLELICQMLYGWSFERVRSNWIARLGSNVKFEECYDFIRMRKV